MRLSNGWRVVTVARTPEPTRTVEVRRLPNPNASKTHAMFTYDWRFANSSVTAIK